MKNKLAIITSGGGMACSWGAGAMLSLAERHGIKEPDILISASGSAGTGTYYLARQYGSIWNIWGNLLSTKNFIDHRRFWKIIDIDYLIDEIFKGQDPLKADMVYNSTTRYYIPAINRDSGEVVYFSNGDGVDIFEVMRAAKAMPIAYNRSICVNGYRYCDSRLTSSTKTHLQKAVKLGAQKIIIIDSGSESRKRNLYHLIFNLWISFQSKGFKNNYREVLRKAREYKPPQDVGVLFVRPRGKLKVSTLNSDKELLRRSVQQGYEETSSDEELTKFLRQ